LAVLVTASLLGGVLLREERRVSAANAALARSNAELLAQQSKLTETKEKQLAQEVRESHADYYSIHARVREIVMLVGDGKSRKGPLPQDEWREILANALEVVKHTIHNKRPGTESQRQTAEAYQTSALIKGWLGKDVEAVGDYSLAKGLWRELAGRHPKEESFAVGLARTCRELGDFLRAGRRVEDALQCYGEAASSLSPVVRDRPDQLEPRRVLREVAAAEAELLTQAGRPVDAIDWWSKAVASADSSTQADLRQRLAACLVQAGDHRRAVEEAEGSVTGPGLDPHAFVNAAVVCAEATTSVRANDELARQYGERAVRLLRQAIARGYKDVAEIRQHPAFTVLRGREDFQKLMAQAAAELKGPKAPKAEPPLW
jgi:tetratricopeptide (TPR) repeat protein